MLFRPQSHGSNYVCLGPSDRLIGRRRSVFVRLICARQARCGAKCVVGKNLRPAGSADHGGRAVQSTREFGHLVRVDDALVVVDAEEIAAALQTQWPNSASKIGADQIAMNFHTSVATSVGIVGPINDYGPPGAARVVVPAIITQLAFDTKCIKLGTHSTRGFDFISDTARGFATVAECDEVGTLLSVDSNFEISIGDTAKLTAEAMDTEVDIESDDKRIRPGGGESGHLVPISRALPRSRHERREFAGFRRVVSQPSNPRRNNAAIVQHRTPATADMIPAVVGLPLYRTCQRLELALTEQMELRVAHLPISAKLGA